MSEQKKSGFVTLVGRPNVGKSTLMNRLIGQKIAITSHRPQTTRNKIQTVYTCDRGQIVFVDTPGIHKAKNKLGEYMVNVAEKTLKEVDVVLWLVEPSDRVGAGDQHIANQLKNINTPVVLVINKIDMVKKDQVFGFIEAYRKLMDFADIVPVAALKGSNEADPIFFSIAPPFPMIIPLWESRSHTMVASISQIGWFGRSFIISMETAIPWGISSSRSFSAFSRISSDTI